MVLLHNLDTGHGIQIRGGNNFLAFFRHSVRAGVPVVDWVSEKFPPFVQKTKIHSPGINSHTDEGFF